MESLIRKQQLISIKKCLSRSAMGVASLLLIAFNAEACGVCMHAYTDFKMPDALRLTGIIVLWFLSLSFFTTVTKSKVKSLPSILKALVIVIVGLFFASAYLGSMVLNLLAVFCIVGSFEVFCKRGKSSQIRSLKRSFYVVNGVALLLSAHFFFHSYELNSKMSGADHILRWEHTYPAKNRFSGMLKNGGEHLPDFRKVAEKGTSQLLEIAAKGLEKYGDPENDVPFLIGALFACRKSDYCKVSEVKVSLIKLSGFDDWPDLSADTSQTEWIKVWNQRMGTGLSI